MRDSVCMGRRDTSPANLLIKIESVSLLSKYGISKYESREFEAGDYKWKVIFYPEGEKQGDKHVGAYLCVSETDSQLPENWEIEAIFTLFLFDHNSDNYVSFQGKLRWFDSVNTKWGFPKLMSKKSLMDPKKGYVVGDSCVLGAEVFVIKPQQRIVECLRLQKPMPTPIKRDWKFGVINIGLCLGFGKVLDCKSPMEATAPELRREWKLSNFSKLGNIVWNSEEFEVGAHKWKVVVYPKGEKSSSAEGRYVSIFAECVDSKSFAPHQKLKAQICMRIKSHLQNTPHPYGKFNHWFTSSLPAWGFPEFIPIADMSSKGLLVDDCCFLEIEISVQALVLDAPKI